MSCRKQKFIEIEFLKSIPVIRRLWKTAGVEIHYFEKVTIHPFTTCKSDRFWLTNLMVIMFFFLGYRQLLDICILLETVFQ